MFSELPIRYYASRDMYPAGGPESWRRGREEQRRNGKRVQILAPREGEGPRKPSLHRHTQMKTISIPTGI